jgi:hypothetical protein
MKKKREKEEGRRSRERKSPLKAGVGFAIDDVNQLSDFCGQ